MSNGGLLSKSNYVVSETHNPIFLLDQHEIEQITKTLSRGAYLWKVRSFSRWFQRWFYVDANSHLLGYHRSGYRKAMCFVNSKVIFDFGDIVDVRKGWRSDVFNQVAKEIERGKHRPGMEINEGACFTVVLGGNNRNRTLDLVAASADECDAWVRGLKHLLHLTKHQEKSQQFDRWLMKMFKAADDNKDGSLSFDECLTLLKQMNVKLRKSYAKRLFNQANTVTREQDKEKVLDANEFVVFYHLLMSRPEINTLFSRYADENDELDSEGLSQFLDTEQKISKHPDDCIDLITEFEPSDLKQLIEPKMSVIGFTNMLLSDEFQLCNPMHLNEVYQDMTQPLSHYYIAASHNTYLTGNQLSGESTVEGYINALMRGCRCVELDCWDGPKGEPVVYHGFTLTTKIMFHDILSDAIKPYAFRKSDYPVILSLEVHCSAEQQARMAHHLASILGDMLYLEPVDDLVQLPSPEELKHKVIVKAKKLKQCVRDSTDGTEESLSASEGESEEEEEIDGEAAVNSGVKKPAHAVECHLSDLVNVCQAVHFHGLEAAKKNGKCYQMSSFSEGKAKKLISSDVDGFVAYNMRQLSRIYPGGKRADSSNFNPIPFWNAGCQIVALNYQGKESPIFYNEAKFQVNQNCGYLLKPSYLRNPASFSLAAEPSWKPKLLRLKVISGQHIPKPDQSSEGEIVDPYVKVKIVGMEIDQREFKTKDIHDNGLNPVWDETFEFPVYYPDLAMLYLSVKDENSTGANELIGAYTLPFTSLQHGFSHCPLLGEVRQKLSPATLFLHVSVD
ncbi:1-phosphatidylinositol 4,5-bisphosphate phosphodiesterase delta-4-like isoform X2 [Neocloeon triangulifer]|uniref:1-phosphatidylinositol 4,5-bisphosphate phosphodiesterase delta-4-like isoform X2 n=2 Tax=Neocloeon triangulifer TaxID=2078957 RepID=UPI00286F8A03|nr:1-phosphatidylinositol 4,5-bisphosphate phosphodiesterase delta-4-like isoform X2 [Neocloeon triangulifer]